MSTPKNKNNNNFIMQASILAIAGIVCRIIGILYRRPLTQVIGDEGNGYYTSAYYIYTITLLISSYSIPSAISKEISQKLAVKEYINAQRIFHIAVIYVLVVGTLASLFAYFGAGLFLDDNSRIVLQVFTPTIFLSGLLGVLRGYFQAHRTMIPSSISQIFEQILNAVISVIAAYLLMRKVASADSTTQAVYGAIGSAVGTGAGVLIALIFMLFVYLYNKDIIKRRILRDTTTQVDSYQRILKRFILSVTPIIFSTFIYNFITPFNQTIYSKLLIYIKDYSSKFVTTQYGIFAGKAVVISNIPIAISSAISAAILPSIARTYIQGNHQETNQKIDMAVRITMLISIPSAVGLAVLSRPIVLILFPQMESLALASSLLRLISITVVLYSLSTLTNAILQGIGKPNLPVINALISLAIQTIILVILLFNTRLDLYVLAIATILYSFLICLLNGISLHKYLGYRINITNNFIVPIAASCIMGSLAFIIYLALFTLFHSNVFALSIAVMTGAILYFYLVIKLGGIKEDELIALPKGNKLITLAKKLRAL